MSPGKRGQEVGVCVWGGGGGEWGGGGTYVSGTELGDTHELQDAASPAKLHFQYNRY